MRNGWSNLSGVNSLRLVPRGRAHRISGVVTAVISRRLRRVQASFHYTEMTCIIKCSCDPLSTAVTEFLYFPP